MAAGSLFICLSFSFSLCSIYTSRVPSTLRKTPDRGCTLSEWERATAVLGTAVGRPFSISPHFCNHEFCYKFPKLLNRFRPVDTLPDPPDVQCADVRLKRGSKLYPLGSPDGEVSVFLPYSPRKPYVNDTSSLSLCLLLSSLPQLPFNHSFIKAPLKAEVTPEPDDAEVLKQTREQSHMQGTDPMSRQFAEVLINIGVEQVNAQKYKEAVKTFNLIIGKAGLSAAVLIGRGTALALAGNLKEAIEDYSKAIQLDPRMMDGWRRRAQARTAFNDLRGAADDYSKCIEIAKAQDGDTLDLITERAMVHVRGRDHYRAAKDFRAILSMKPGDPEVVLTLGQTLTQLGETKEAIDVLSGMVEKHGYHKIVWIHLGNAHRDHGDYKKAKEAFQRSVQLDSSYAQGYQLLANLQFRLGDYRGALRSAQKCIQHQASSVEGRYIKATCHHVLGDFASAVREYDVLLSMSSLAEDQFMVFLGFYQREVAAYTASRMNFPLRDFDVNSHFPPEFKEWWATRQSPAALVPGYNMEPMTDALRYTGTFPITRGLTKEIIEGRKNLVKAADALGAWMHTLGSYGPPNQRLLRALGMAAIEVMQGLRRKMEESEEEHWSDRFHTLRGEEEEEEEEEGGSESEGVMKGWRDLYERVVKWLTLGDPTNAYVWIDHLTEGEFKRGFGVTSVIISGHTKNPQYYSQSSRALTAVKEEMLDSGQVLTKVDSRGHATKILDLDPAVGPQIEHGESLKDLWTAVGQDFVVVTPCFSTGRRRHILNGTSLNIARLPDDDGFQFSLRTLLTPIRWKDYDKELTSAWKHLNAILLDTSASKQKVLGAALRLSYYWYNFMPLAQGSALAGNVGLVGSLLAAELEFTKKVKTGTQIDWQAVLSPTRKGFVEQVDSWMLTSLKPLDKYSDLPDLHKAYPTVSSVVQMLDIYDKK